MAKSRRKRDRQTPSDRAESNHDAASRAPSGSSAKSSRDASGNAAAHSPYPIYLPDADPPRPNRALLITAVVLFAVWFAVLVYIAMWM